MNNANCYALENKARYIYDSDSEQQYQFLGNNIVRTEKSMSMISQKQHKVPRNAQMKKSNSFLLSTKPQPSHHKAGIEQKEKSKTSTKKCLNVTEVRKKPPINSKNSMTKTSVSIGNTSGKSVKSVKNKSFSRDYIMIGQQIYHCDNIEEVNEKLICGSSPVYSHERFIKATLKNQQNLQKYILTLVQLCRYAKKTQPHIRQLSQSQKKKLYLLLKSQTTDNSIESQKSLDKKLDIQSLIKQAYNKIEQKSSKTIKEKPQEQKQIRRWKNKKLHQLMQIHTCLKEETNFDQEQEQQGEEEQQQGQEEEKLQKQIVRKKFQFAINLPLNGQSVQSNTFSELSLNSWTKKQAKNAKFSIQSHQIEDKYPEPKKQIFKNVDIPFYLTSQHVLSKSGIQSFLHNLWDYLVDSDKIGQLIHNLSLPFGFSNSQKLQILNNNRCRGQLPSRSPFGNLIIPNSVFISFCKQDSSLLQAQEQQKKYLIIFQKAIFDALNQQLTKYQIDFPFGCYHPFQNNNNSAVYFIDQSNAMLVWEQCMEAVYNMNEIGLGKLNNNKQILNSDKQFKQWMKQQSKFYEWQIPIPLARRNILEQLISSVYDVIVSQATLELLNF